ncbi:hypothetical protein BJ508DRAFT_150797 [Ascobolus immersus RN42]|uniref:Uncharacterized protein n=1 Tax=Ascobolus immersus RN42 TaxID=1160509 RepID=A0A3N4I407_ASCIM|nr:hypothetical protein BJ508DRAFT_150797 [Ascobolus immersus RN42]
MFGFLRGYRTLLRITCYHIYLPICFLLILLWLVITYVTLFVSLLWCQCRCLMSLAGRREFGGCLGMVGHELIVT